MRENRTSGSMRRDEKRVMVNSANGHRTRKGGNGGAPPDLYTTALALHSTGLLGSRWKPLFPPVFHHALRTPRVAEARGGVPLYIGLQLVPVA